MSCPLFLVGPSRSGTTFAEQLLRLSPGICDDRYIPFPRWDFLAAMEVGGDTGQTPQLSRALAWAEGKQEPYALIRLALPWAYTSLGWSHLWQYSPAAAIVTIARNWFDTWSSWLEMPHRKRLDQPAQQTAFREWHGTMVEGFRAGAKNHPKNCTTIAYEQLLDQPDKVIAGVCNALGVLPPADTLQPLVRKPEHWSEGFANWWEG
ncbi:hypothetical protein LCGC14_1484160 [marine sediment metagenome]|uniref:Sulfotransferase domain-containing protein n=1 Tax=marine sediment metagenome TaxID=412755 RepID=A0A0F9LP26_9ZZZZ